MAGTGGAVEGGKLGAKLGAKLGPKLGARLGPKLGAKLVPKLGGKLGPKLGGKLGAKLDVREEGARLGARLGAMEEGIVGANEGGRGEGPAADTGVVTLALDMLLTLLLQIIQKQYTCITLQMNTMN